MLFVYAATIADAQLPFSEPSTPRGQRIPCMPLRDITNEELSSQRTSQKAQNRIERFRLNAHLNALLNAVSGSEAEKNMKIEKWFEIYKRCKLVRAVAEVFFPGSERFTCFLPANEFEKLSKSPLLWDMPADEMISKLKSLESFENAVFSFFYSGIDKELLRVVLGSFAPNFKNRLFDPIYEADSIVLNAYLTAAQKRCTKDFAAPLNAFMKTYLARHYRNTEFNLLSHRIDLHSKLS